VDLNPYNYLTATSKKASICLFN